MIDATHLVHLNWAVASNSTRMECDAFFLDVFAAQTAFELLLTSDLDSAGMDREESLLLVGDTMLIPIAAAGAGDSPASVIGQMLRDLATPRGWIGVALHVPDLAAADRRLGEFGYKRIYRPGQEQRYFITDPGETLGLRFEFITVSMPHDPRDRTNWSSTYWRDHHPLEIEGLLSVGVSVSSIEDARRFYGEACGWRELSSREIPDEPARATAFIVGNTVFEALEPLAEGTDLAAHCADGGGIYCITFKVRSVERAAKYLASKGIAMLGDVATGRITIDPDHAFGRRIVLETSEIEGDPRSVGSVA